MKTIRKIKIYKNRLNLKEQLSGSHMISHSKNTNNFSHSINNLAKKTHALVNKIYRNTAPISLTLMLASCEGAFAKEKIINYTRNEEVAEKTVAYQFPTNLENIFIHERRNINRVVDRDRNISRFRIYYQY